MERLDAYSITCPGPRTKLRRFAPAENDFTAKQISTKQPREADNPVMGRGRGKLVGVACEAPRRGAAVQRDTVIDRLGFGSLLSSRAGRAASSDKVVRPLAGRSFVSDLEVWKQQEHEFIEGARAELEAGMRDFARSGQWGAFLRMATQSPEYSMMNSLWARGQMRAKWERLVERGEADAGEFGDPETGRFFSASAAKALGARIRDEYYHRPSSADYDDRFTVEMCKPLGFNGYWAERTVTDAAGGPVIDPRTGTPRNAKSSSKPAPKVTAPSKHITSARWWTRKDSLSACRTCRGRTRPVLTAMLPP